MLMNKSLSVQMDHQDNKMIVTDILVLIWQGRSIIKFTALNLLLSFQ
jgi:hypothetical protein